MLKNCLILTSAIASVILLGSCNASREDTYTKQMTGIISYLDEECKKDPTGKVYYTTIDGSARLTRDQGSTVSFEEGDTVDFIFTGYLFDSFSISQSKIFTTNDSTVTWHISDSSRIKNAPYRFIYGQGGIFTGLSLGLDGIHDKEQCEIIFPSALGAGQSRIGTITANTPLAFVVKVDSVRKAKH